MNWLGLVLLPLFFFLPGYLITRALWRDSSFLSAGEKVFLPIAASLCLTVWIGLLLAELGVFSIAGLAALVAGASALIWIALRPELLPVLPRPGGEGHGDASSRHATKEAKSGLWRDDASEVRADWVFVAILLLGIVLYAKPAEYVIGNSDAGTYINLGASIARTGGIAILDPQVASLEADAGRQFFWDLINPYMLYKQVRLPGFFIADRAQGLVLPQFLHLYPVWLAIFDALFGVQVGLFATPLIALLGSIAFYFLVRALYNQNLARLAFFVLVITVPQFWFARYPVAEAMTQFLVLTGMWALIRFSQDLTGLEVKNLSGLIGFALLAGVAFGQVFLTRADGILLLVPLGIYALVVLFGRLWRRVHLVFLGAFAVVFVHAAAHMLLFAPNYLYFEYSHVLRMNNIDKLLPGGLPKAEELFTRGESLILLLVLGVIGLAILFVMDRAVQWARRHWGKSLAVQIAQREKWLRAAGAVFVVVAFVFAFFIWARPETWYAYIGGETPAESSANLIKLGWYLSPAGLVLAVLGAVIVILHELNRRNAFFFGTAALFSVFYLEELYSNPHYIYTTRHYIPLVIPLLVLLAVHALAWLWHWRAQPQGQRIARLAAGGAFGLWMIYSLYAMGIVDFSRANGLALRVPFVQEMEQFGAVRIESFEKSIAGVNELGGVYAQIETLARSLDRNAILVMSGNNRDEPATIATPLYFLYGLDTFVARFNQPNGEKVASMIDDWRAQGREVILVFGTNGGRLVVPRYDLEPIGDFALDAPQWAFAYDFMPRSAWRVNLNFALFRAVPRAAPPDYPFVIDFGGYDFPYLVSGFLERPTEGVTRWIGTIPAANARATEPQSLVGAVRVPVSSHSSRNLELTVTARAPQPKTRLEIKSGAAKLGEVELSPEFADFRLAIARENLRRDGETFLLEFVVPAFADGEGRLLGVEFKKLEIRD